MLCLTSGGALWAESRDQSNQSGLAQSGSGILERVIIAVFMA